MSILVDSVTPTVDVVSGVPGLNSRQTWFPADGSPAVVLNEPDRNLWPRIRLVGGIAGWGTPPPGEDRRDDRVGMPLREITRTSLLRGKPLTYQGVVEAESDVALRDLTGQLAAAFGDATMREGRMLVEPWDGRPVVDYVARVTGWDCPESYPNLAALGRRSRGHERAFTLQVHLPWGRMFATLESSVASGDTVRGDASDPHLCRCHNDGSAPTEPELRITNVRETESIINNTTGEVLRFTGLPATGTLVVDFAARTAKRSGVDVRGNLDRAASTWWRRGVGLRPRLNNIGLTNGAAGQLTVTWRSAHW